jgi:hypothetical protein
MVTDVLISYPRLLTVSLFGPSFPQPLPVHPANDRFLAPLFSYSYKSLFRNSFPFTSVQNPRGCGRAHFQFSTPCLYTFMVNSMFSERCSLFVVSLRYFLHSVPLFSIGCSLFSQNTWGGVPCYFRRTRFGKHFQSPPRILTQVPAGSTLQASPPRRPRSGKERFRHEFSSLPTY